MKNHKGHHILPTSIALGVGIALLILTIVTVWVANVDLGRFNFFIAMFVATIKATLVAAYFMNLKYDKLENTVIFSTSFLFLAIFLILTATDIFFRGDVYVKDIKNPFPGSAQGPSKFKKAWNSTPALVAHGKSLYAAQCVACHGTHGKGDGPAAAALDPRPRNFVSGSSWKGGRKASQVFKTLRDGLGKMPAFGTLPADDRWGLAHYVISLGPVVEADTSADLAKIGIDPTKDSSGAEGPKGIPIDVAMKRMAVLE